MVYGQLRMGRAMVYPSVLYLAYFAALHHSGNVFDRIQLETKEEETTEDPGYNRLFSWLPLEQQPNNDYVPSKRKKETVELES